MKQLSRFKALVSYRSLKSQKIASSKKDPLGDSWHFSESLFVSNIRVHQNLLKGKCYYVTILSNLTSKKKKITGKAVT